MPRYDFKCLNCGAIRKDVWVSNYRDASNTFNASELTPCACGSRLWEKLPCAPNFTIGGFSEKNGYGLR